MPINLQGSGNIAEGWGAPPKLDAPNISGVLGEILQQRRYQEALTQKNIAGAIKQMQEQRQSQAYLEAMQKAGILPEGDYGALGAEGASDLAKQILAKKLADAREAHLGALTAHVGSGRGGGGGGGGGGGSGSGLEFVIDPQTGLRYQVNRTSKSVTYKLAPGQGGAAAPKLSPTERGWAAPEIPGVSVNINAPDDTIPLAPDVPPMPAPAEGADKNLAQGYGTDATSMSSDDVRAAYRAGKMTIEEAKARLKAMGFSD